MCHDYEGWFRARRTVQPARRDEPVEPRTAKPVEPVAVAKREKEVPRVETREKQPA